MTELDEICEDGFAMLELLGRKRGMLISGGEVNTERAAITLLDEFRSGKQRNCTPGMRKSGRAVCCSAV